MVLATLNGLNGDKWEPIASSYDVTEIKTRFKKDEFGSYDLVVFMTSLGYVKKRKPKIEKRRISDKLKRTEKSEPKKKKATPEPKKKK